MVSLSSFNHGVKYLCVTVVSQNMACVKPLTNKKPKKVHNAFFE